MGEAASFHHFVGEQLENGDDRRSPEETLEMWRALYPNSEEFIESVAAVKRALDQAERGEAKNAGRI